MKPCSCIFHECEADEAPAGECRAYCNDGFE